MIESFKHKGLKLFFETGSTKGIQAIHKDKIREILTILNVMEDLTPLSLPSYRLHKLQGDKNNIWSVTVQANWQITFMFDEKKHKVLIVDYQDYH